MQEDDDWQRLQENQVYEEIGDTPILVDEKIIGQEGLVNEN